MNWLDYDSFAVWGMGVSGRAAANLLARRGKSVLLSDLKDGPREGLEPTVRVKIGENALEDATQVVVVSPGLKPSLEVFKSLPADLPVVSEIDIAFDATNTPFIGITGTDGKTTTTLLVTHLLTEAGVRAVAAGNIGTPICDVVDGDWEVIVAEVSAFQLWSTHHFHAHINIFTNLAADHLDYFDSFEEYVEAKHRLVKFTDAEDVAIFNLDDVLSATWPAEHSGRIVTYGVGERGALMNHFKVSEKRLEGPEGEEFDSQESQLIGLHNRMNMASALAAGASYGLDWDTMCDALRSFKPLAHRIEPCGRVGEIAFINDSKATNAHAAMAGIRAIEGPITVITGGVDKGLELAPFAKLLAERAKNVVIIGQLQQRLGAELNAAGVEVQLADSMEAAVAHAIDKTEPGGTIVLSPAASSFDMFGSYTERGDAFKACVRTLQQ